MRSNLARRARSTARRGSSVSSPPARSRGRATGSSTGRHTIQASRLAVPGAWPRALAAGAGPGGLEVASLTVEQFADALRAENHTPKRALTDPRVFNGIGNSYSDEILHAARVARLHEACVETRREAIFVAWYASGKHFDGPRIGRRSDEVFERGETFRGYRAVPSVIDYLLVAHDRVRVEHYTRSRDDTWVLREHGPDLVDRNRARTASGSQALPFLPD